MITQHKLVVDNVDYYPTRNNFIDSNINFRYAYYIRVKLMLMDIINRCMDTNQVQYKAMFLSTNIGNIIKTSCHGDANTVFKLEVFTNDALQDDVIVLATDMVEVYNIDRILKMKSFLEE